MAAPDEEPIAPRRRPFPEWVKHYGGPRDNYDVIFDTFDERGFITRRVKMRSVLEYVSIEGTISDGTPQEATPPCPSRSTRSG